MKISEHLKLGGLWTLEVLASCGPSQVVGIAGGSVNLGKAWHHANKVNFHWQNTLDAYGNRPLNAFRYMDPNAVYSSKEDLQWLTHELKRFKNEDKLSKDLRTSRVCAKALAPFIGTIWALRSKLSERHTYACYSCPACRSNTEHHCFDRNAKDALEEHIAKLKLKF